MSFPDLPKPDRRIGRMAIVEKLKLLLKNSFQNIVYCLLFSIQSIDVGKLKMLQDFWLMIC
jgi:hypothetical protein